MAQPSHLRLVPSGPDVSAPDVSAPDVSASDAGMVDELGSSDSGLTIDCAVCEVRDTDACDDCVVSYLVGHEAGTPVVLDAEEKRAVDLLADAGLVPASRFAPRPGVA